MRPLPPAQLERVILADAYPEDDGLELSMRELLTKLLIARRSAEDNRLVALLKKGEAFSAPHLNALIHDKLTRWKQRWEDGDEAQEEGGEGQGEGEDGAPGGGGESIIDSDHREYDGPDFDSFGELPSSLSFAASASASAACVFFSLSVVQRVVLLRCLCDEHLSFSASFASTVRSVLPRDARIPPIASDAAGHRYFFFMFPDYRIYREDALKPIKPRQSRKKITPETHHNHNSAPTTAPHSSQADSDEDGADAAVSDDLPIPPSTSSSSSSSPSPSPSPSLASSPSPSSSPGFHLLSDSAATLKALIDRLRRSAQRKDKAVASALQEVYDDLQQGRGRADVEEGEDEEEEGEQAGKKAVAGGKKRRARGSSEGEDGSVAKRSVRLMLVMAEKEEQEKQRQVQAEAAREHRAALRQDIIAHQAQAYIDRIVNR